MNASQRVFRRIRSAFSLIELLVAVAVLALILILFTQVISSVRMATGRGQARLDSDSTARLALDRLAADLETLVRRDDVDVRVEKNAGNDRLFFIAEAPASDSAVATPDSLRQVGYGVGLSEEVGQGLQRDARAFSWSGSDAFRHLPGGWSIPSTFSENTTTSISDQILRFEIEILRDDGSTGGALPTRAETGEGPLRYVDGGGNATSIAAANVSSLEGVRALIISLVTVDPQARNRFSNEEWENLRTTLETAFPDSETQAAGDLVSRGTLRWPGLAEAPPAAIPATAAGHLRVFRRIIPIYD